MIKFKGGDLLDALASDEIDILVITTLLYTILTPSEGYYVKIFKGQYNRRTGIK